ncbi:DUF262 domain-containing protein [Labrys sp. ZIDIC5]|uniref:DUF262 domain-containing protein n=1 Tax=Labrys sedimenti TaxID=3106036 RepID=UPI002ACA6170|nr:DUF262 domain-containing protein [Labrys sp. ZIDIC5]MDZ5452320.1 DUF262 domain-containing protein [Labrys sp. ZIDIC5]
MSENTLKELTPEEDIDGLDAEDAGGHSGAIKPWDPGKIRITTKSFTLREIVDQIDDGDIDLSPDFQREYVWKARQRTRLIESILLGIPLPAFYFNQTETGAYQVVDGVQRLSTIALFMRNEHRLSNVDLEYLSDLHDLTYGQLDTASVRRFRSTQIVVHVIEPQTPDEVKYDIFNRVNTLGSPLSAQEIRHAMSGIRSRQFIGRLAEHNDFDTATERHYWKRSPEGAMIRDSGRMANRELALRFCAFRTSSIEQYRQFASLDAFLMNFTKRIDGTAEPAISDDTLANLESAFNRAMTAAHEILGPAAFRRWPHGADRRGPINRAVFEAQANALADHSLETLLPHRDVIVDAFRKAFLEPEYLRAVTVGTGDVNRVAYRLDRTRQILKEALK